MKKNIIILFSIIVLLLFASCSGSGQNIKEEITVNNAVDFLKAIAPNTRIILEPGDYYLNRAILEIGSTKYIQPSDYLEEELNIIGVENLEIIGKDGAHLVTENKFAAVLNFMDSKNITISNVKAGHEIEKGLCMGAVFIFYDTTTININNADMYGSGTVGVTLFDCADVTIKNSIIRECTYGITELHNSVSVKFENCEFKENQEYSMVNILKSEDVLFSRCLFIDNISDYETDSMFNVLSSIAVTVENSKLFNNTAYYLETIKDSVEFVDTEIDEEQFKYGTSMYLNEAEYYGEGDYESIETNNYYDETETYDDDWKSIAGSDVYRIKTTEEFLENIGSNRTLILEEGEYNFGGNLVYINSVENLIIKGEGAVSILTEYAYDVVMSFYDCKNIELENFTAGHIIEKGACAGGVIGFNYAKNISLKKLDLFGCGTEGLTLYRVNKLTADNIIIRECTYGLMSIESSKYITVSNSVLKDSGEFELFVIMNSFEILLNNCEIINNFSTGSIFYIDASNSITLKNSVVKDNNVLHFENKRGSVTVLTSDIDESQFKEGWS